MNEKVIEAEFKEEKTVKVSEEVLKQINARDFALKGANTLFQMAQAEAQNYIKEQLKALGLDEKKQYNIDQKTGIVSEIKVEPVKKED